MRNETSELLSLIGAIQTLVANFPMGIFSSIKAKNYTSVIDFVMDCLRMVGIGDVEMLSFILDNILDVKLDLKHRDKLQNWMDNLDETTVNSGFINAMEDIIKSTVSLILSEILSNQIHPKLPDYCMTDGINCPLSVIDPDKLLNTCPTSPGGRMVYMGIDETWKPSMLNKSKDLNAVIWYGLYEGDTNWKGKRAKEDDTPLFFIKNSNFTHVNIKVNPAIYTKSDGKNKSLLAFNRDYLNSIQIFTAKSLLSYFLDFIFAGNLPSIAISYNITDIITQGTINNIIKEVVEKDDMEIDDSYYSFSNEDWIQMLEDTELIKYNGIKNAHGEIGTVNGSKLLDSLTQISNSNATLHEQKELITRAVYDTKVTAATDTTGLISDSINLNSEWVVNVTSLFITPFVKCLFSPQVLTLLYMNYEIAGLVDLTMVTDFNWVINFLINKVLSMVKQLVKIIKDMIVDLLLKLFNKTIGPLIEKYTLASLMERLENYMAILEEALECIQLFTFDFGNVLTQIDNVNYADIIPEKITPQTS